MNASTARKLEPQRKIVMTVCENGENLVPQRLAGLGMLVLIAFALFSGTEFAALAIVSPMALAAVFSGEKLLDFGIFPKIRLRVKPRKFSRKKARGSR
ncbi:MAG: hypothetical protein NC253_09930 [Ruminococcus sp.]|nr:hypothetical protein [Ruminococcus sp.]MCM1381732.1 hypothetical protein [Muribaculaceae bacterium]MCM1479702.1 hypothetical protein [Muribaculaceae bacterium]